MHHFYCISSTATKTVLFLRHLRQFHHTFSHSLFLSLLFFPGVFLFFFDVIRCKTVYGLCRFCMHSSLVKCSWFFFASAISPLFFICQATSVNGVIIVLKTDLTHIHVVFELEYKSSVRPMFSAQETKQ